MMHVTVLMAVYNERPIVGAAIESVRAQTGADWDLLIVDDASTDGSDAVLGEYAAQDPRITVVRNAENLGLAASLNAGWRQARGELIARADADDGNHPERLDRQVRFLAAHPEVAVLGTWADLVDDAGNPLGVGRRPEGHDDLVRTMFKENPFFHSSVMMRRSFLASMDGYDDRLRRSQDYDLWLRAYRRFRFHNLPEPLIRYVARPTLSFRAIRDGARVLARAARREGRLAAGGFYTMRYVTTALLAKAGVWRRHAG